MGNIIPGVAISTVASRNNIKDRETAKVKRLFDKLFTKAELTEFIEIIKDNSSAGKTEGVIKSKLKDYLLKKFEREFSISQIDDETLENIVDSLKDDEIDFNILRKKLIEIGISKKDINSKKKVLEDVISRLENIKPFKDSSPDVWMNSFRIILGTLQKEFYKTQIDKKTLKEIRKILDNPSDLKETRINDLLRSIGISEEDIENKRKIWSNYINVFELIENRYNYMINTFLFDYRIELIIDPDPNILVRYYISKGFDENNTLVALKKVFSEIDYNELATIYKENIKTMNTLSEMFWTNYSSKIKSTNDIVHIGSLMKSFLNDLSEIQSKFDIRRCTLDTTGKDTTDNVVNVFARYFCYYYTKDIDSKGKEKGEKGEEVGRKAFRYALKSPIQKNNPTNSNGQPSSEMVQESKKGTTGYDGGPDFPDV